MAKPKPHPVSVRASSGAASSTRLVRARAKKTRPRPTAVTPLVTWAVRDWSLIDGPGRDTQAVRIDWYFNGRRRGTTGRAGDVEQAVEGGHAALDAVQAGAAGG